MKIAVQCDFDGTITVGEVSHRLLEEFARGDWRSIVGEFRSGRLGVEETMKRCFAMIDAGEAEMLDFLRRDGNVIIRPGFADFLDFCRRREYYVAIISNGLTLYIKHILEDAGLMEGVEIFAAASRLTPGGWQLSFYGPGGNPLNEDFKESYARYLKKAGYHIMYIGDSISDVPPVRLAARVFATDKLVDFCHQEGIDCLPFTRFNEIIEAMEARPL